jgi:putative transposase
MDMSMQAKPRQRNSIAAQAAARGPLPALPKGFLDQLDLGLINASQITDLTQQFKKALIERALNTELSNHSGYPPGQDKPEGQVNERNGPVSRRP